MFGLPMRRIESRFMDVVAGRMVNLYEDRKGRRWLAFHRWSLFDRMRVDN